MMNSRGTEWTDASVVGPCFYGNDRQGFGRLASSIFFYHLIIFNFFLFFLFFTFPCGHGCSCCGGGLGRSTGPRRTLVNFSANVSTRPLKPSLPRLPPCDRRFCVCNLLRNYFPSASMRPRARICGRTSGIPSPQRAMQPAGRTSNAPSSTNMASVRAWWRRRACRGCERKRTATNRVAPHSLRPTRTAGTCSKGPAMRSTKHTTPSMQGSVHSTASESRSSRSSRNAPSGR